MRGNFIYFVNNKKAHFGNMRDVMAKGSNEETIKFLKNHTVQSGFMANKMIGSKPRSTIARDLWPSPS